MEVYAGLLHTERNYVTQNALRNSDHVCTKGAAAKADETAANGSYFTVPLFRALTEHVDLGYRSLAAEATVTHAMTRWYLYGWLRVGPHTAPVAPHCRLTSRSLGRTTQAHVVFHYSQINHFLSELFIISRRCHTATDAHRESAVLF